MRPRPHPSPISEQFWAATAESTLLLQRCQPCGTANFYPRVNCIACGAQELHWEEASGRGTLHTFTIARRATHPAFEGEGPYAVAIVALEEGPHMTTNLVDCDLDALRIDQAVELVWDEAGEDGYRLPLFRPV